MLKRALFYPFWPVMQLMRHTFCREPPFKIERMRSDEILPACNKIAGWKLCRFRQICKIHAGIKGLLVVIRPEDGGAQNLHRPTRRQKHAGGKAQGIETQPLSLIHI